MDKPNRKAIEREEAHEAAKYDHQAQRVAVDRLVSRGWRVDTCDDTAVYLSKSNRKLRGQTLYCQVDETGDVE